MRVTSWLGAMGWVMAVGGCYNWDPPPQPVGESDDPYGSDESDVTDNGGDDAETEVPDLPPADGPPASEPPEQPDPPADPPDDPEPPPPPDACDGYQTCVGCTNCALEDTCGAAASACANDWACSAFADCISFCASSGCIENCADAIPNGVALFLEAAQCVVCDVCGSQCDSMAALIGCE